MFELKKVSVAFEGTAHICLPCYYCRPWWWPCRPMIEIEK